MAEWTYMLTTSKLYKGQAAFLKIASEESF